MGQVIPFPTSRQSARPARTRRVFEAQREMEKAQQHAHMMMLGAFLTASAMMLGLSLLAHVS